MHGRKSTSSEFCLDLNRAALRSLKCLKFIEVTNPKDDARLASSLGKSDWSCYDEGTCEVENLVYLQLYKGIRG